MTPRRKPRSHLTATVGGLIALLSSACIDRAMAQTVLDTAAIYHSETGAAAASPTLPRDLQLANPADVKTPLLRHLPASRGGWRIGGETGTRAWHIFLTADDATRLRTFRLAYSSAISVLPDQSAFEVRINDVRIDRRPIAAPSDRKPIDIDIPAGTLRPGLNTISLMVAQRHRVDCSLEATYELWTDIDPAKTGFLDQVSDASPDLSGLAALHARADGAMVIRVLFRNQMRPQQINHAIRLTQAIARAGRFDHTLVSFTADPDAATGVNLMVGDASDLIGMLGADQDVAKRSGTSVSLTSVAGLRAPTLIVKAANDDDVAAAIEHIARMAAIMRKPDEADHDSAIAVTGGERIRLSDAGLPTTDFTGRLFRLPMAIRMPSDFFAADYDKLLVSLRGVYAGDLTALARLTIRVNGYDIATVPLPKPSRSGFALNDIGVPLSALRPGPNTVEIAAELPGPSQAECNEVGTAASAGNHFRLLDTSEIRIPHLARVAQMPALSQTQAGGFPYATPGTTPKLYVPTPDRDTLSAAATLAVKLSLVAGRLLPFDIVLANPATGAEPGIVVAPAQALDPAMMTAIQLDPAAVRRAWEHPRSIIETRSPASVVVSSPADEPSTLTWLSDRARLLRARVFAAGNPDLELSPDAALIVAQGYPTSADNAVVTVVTAPDSATLATSVAALVGPDRWTALTGRLSVMDGAANLLHVVEPSSVRLIQTQPVSPGNARLIVAGWLSLHPAAYVLAALLIAACLAAASTALVQRLGRRNT